MIAPAAAPSIIERGPSFRSLLGKITFTSDGSAWIQEADGVIRITPAGTVTQKRRPDDCPQCTAPRGDIVTAADGTVWSDGYGYTGTAHGGIAFADGGRPRPAQAPLAADAGLRVLARGNDGASWFVREPNLRLEPVWSTPWDSGLSFRKGGRTYAGIAKSFVRGRELTRFLIAPDDSLIASMATNGSGGQGRFAIVRITTAGDVTLLTTITTSGAIWNAIGDWAISASGDIWLTENWRNGIERISPTGTLTAYRTGNPAGLFGDAIAVAPDGAVWFDNAFYARIVRRAPDGTLRVWGNGLAPMNVPGAPAVTSDGSAWFLQTLTWHRRLTQISRDGAIHDVPLPAPPGGLFLMSARGARLDVITASQPANAFERFLIDSDGHMTKETLTGCLIATLDFVCVPGFRIPANLFVDYAIPGPDGRLWFTQSRLSRIGSLDRNGTVRYFTRGLTRWNSGPQYMTVGPDGAIWFTEIRDRIGRIAADGTIREFSRRVPFRSFIGGIATSRDGNLWFTLYHGNELVRMTTAGATTRFRAGIYPSRGNDYVVPDAVPTLGPSGDLWFNEPQGGRLARATITSAARAGAKSRRSLDFAPAALRSR